MAMKRRSSPITLTNSANGSARNQISPHRASGVRGIAFIPLSTNRFYIVYSMYCVDDGWQVSIGDWEANAKFPSGMNTLAKKIKSTGLKAGLWLAPLIAVESSRLFRKHPN